MLNLKKVKIAGKLIDPIIEGGKGVALSTGLTSGRFAAQDCAGTFSAVMADTYDENGNPNPAIIKGDTPKERHKELVRLSIEGGVANAEIAYKESQGKGRILMNILWGVSNSREILEGILERAKGKIHGISVGAGMPYQLGEIAAKFKVHYQPIVSSARAFRALWSRGFEKTQEWLGGVIYEDPWVAGGHNGISGAEDPKKRESAYDRIVELRKFMNSVGLAAVPIIIAGGIWTLSECTQYMNNPEVGEVAFQLGTRPLLTKESPVSQAWREKMLSLKEGDIKLQKFSPTGMYSSAIDNEFVRNLNARKERQVAFSDQANETNDQLYVLPSGKNTYVSTDSLNKITEYANAGFNVPLPTPDSTLVFETPGQALKIVAEQKSCVGCLAGCKFSGWCERDDIKIEPDPRSFCIQKTLVAVAHGGDIENNLMFSGHSAYRFANDPLFANGKVPTIEEFLTELKKGA